MCDITIAFFEELGLTPALLRDKGFSAEGVVRLLLLCAERFPSSTTNAVASVLLMRVCNLDRLSNSLYAGDSTDINSYDFDDLQSAVCDVLNICRYYNDESRDTCLESMLESLLN